MPTPAQAKALEKLAELAICAKRLVFAGQSPSHELAALIERGKQEFDEIYVEPEANPPIVLDGKADDVFEAIIKKRYRAIPFWDPGLVAAWRHYVLSDGPMPRRPGPRRARASHNGQPTPNGHAD